MKFQTLRLRAAALTLGLLFTSSAFATETVTLGDGTTCTVIEGNSITGGGTTSSVTAGGGSVTSSTTIDGKTTTMHSGSGSASSSAGSSTSSSTNGAQAFSSASVTRPDGSVVTRRSDGTCDIVKPNK
ncbi:hypothetical protein [Shinella sp. G-2]|uniref:hypothetical protein n=1 Tax=Shinella sp. G-2 TaxID=3133141 RepID=UPI003CFE847C